MPDPLPVSRINHMHFFVRSFNNRRITEFAFRLVFEFGDIVPVNSIHGNGKVQFVAAVHPFGATLHGIVNKHLQAGGKRYRINPGIRV